MSSSEISVCSVCGSKIPKDTLREHIVKEHIVPLQKPSRNPKDAKSQAIDSICKAKQDANRRISQARREKRAGGDSGKDTDRQRVAEKVAQISTDKKSGSKSDPKPTPEAIVLISRRGVRLERDTCDACGKIRPLLYRYAESNRGAVKVCSLCKPKVFDRSFGKIDALNQAWQGGGFETNRRKY